MATDEYLGYMSYTASGSWEMLNVWAQQCWTWFDPLVKDPQRRNGNHPVSSGSGRILEGWRSLVGHSPRGQKSRT